MLVLFTHGNTFSLNLVSMPKEIDQGKSPAIRVFERTWNDESTALEITMKSPTEVSNRNILGLTLLFV